MSSEARHLTPQPSIDDFLAMEEASPTKHEYLAGQIYALAGASARHNRIAGNIFAHLWMAARAGPCRVYGSDMRLRVGNQAVYYPDVQVVCDVDEREDSFTTQPCVVVEVLSPSTSAIDRREKMLVYRGIDSLRAYLIVDQDSRRVIRHYRAEDNAWYDTVHGPDTTIRFPCPDVELSLEAIYQGLD